MPLYDYKCKTCGKEYQNIKLSINSRHTDKPVCCGEPVEMQIRPPRESYVQFFENYVCPVSGENVTSMRQRRRIMAEHDLVEQKQIKSGEY